MIFGEVPELSIRQKLKLALSGSCFLRFQQPKGYRSPVAVYVVKCPIHGLYLDNRHGNYEYFQCDDCLAEETNKASKQSTTPAYKEVISDLDFQEIPADLKVSCPFSGANGCKSPSKRDPTMPKAWVCGSNFSHNERLTCCVAYRRLDNSLRRGGSAHGRRGC